MTTFSANLFADTVRYGKHKGFFRIVIESDKAFIQKWKDRYLLVVPNRLKVKFFKPVNSESNILISQFTQEDILRILILKNPRRIVFDLKNESLTK